MSRVITGMSRPLASAATQPNRLRPKRCSSYARPKAANDSRVLGSSDRPVRFMWGRNMIRALLVLALATCATQAAASQISGRDQAIGSAIIQSNDHRTVLFGIDAAMPKRTCRFAAGMMVDRP